MRVNRLTTYPATVLAALVLVVLAPSARADSVAGHGDITATGNAGTILDITYDGTTYVADDGEIVNGTTTKWDGDTQIFDGTYPPEGADNLSFAVNADCCSLDGITHMITLFDGLHDTFFIYENGGNQPGDIQCVFADDTLGTAQAFTSGTFTDTTYNTGVGGQDLKGLVFTTDVPVKGVRINSSGFDCFTVAAVVPEPGMMATFGFGLLGLILRRRLRRR